MSGKDLMGSSGSGSGAWCDASGSCSSLEMFNPDKDTLMDGH